MSPPTATKTAVIGNIRSYCVFFLLLLPALTLAVTAQQALAAKNLFNSDPSSSTSAPAQELVASSSDDSAILEEPALSATDAALRAQQYANGQVMNVRQFQDENKILYGVKVLQKNGRMKTINIDANNGNIVE